MSVVHAVLLRMLIAAAATVPCLADPHAQDTPDRGWKTVRLENGLVSLDIVPEIGGRIIQFRLGTHEFLWVNPELAGQVSPPSGLAADGGWLNYGGDKLWPAPQGWENDEQWPGPPDAVLDGQPHRLELLDAGRAARLTSRDDPRSGIRFTRVVRPIPERSGVAFEATMTNIDHKPRRWGIWAHTQLDATGAQTGEPNTLMRAWCPVNPRSRFPRGYRILFGAEDNPAFRLHADQNLLEARYLYRVGKVGLDSPDGWVATVNGRTGAVFVQRFTFEQNQEYPDASSVEFWHNGTGRIHAYGKDLDQPNDPRKNPFVFESEILSPYARLEPGDSYTWRYQWFAAQIGGDYPILHCTDAGITAEPLKARSAAGGQLRLSGRFGVFTRSTPHIAWRNAQGHTIARSPLPAPASPDQPLLLDTLLTPPPDAREAALICDRELSRTRLP